MPGTVTMFSFVYFGPKSMGGRIFIFGRVGSPRGHVCNVGR